MIMNWIDRIFRREAVLTEAKQQTAVGADYKQNVVWANTPTRAMKIAAVFRAVNLISSGLASLKLEYKRKDRVKGYFKFDNGKAGSRLNYLLSVQPNSRMNASVFLKNLVSQILLQGNAYVLPVKNILGEVEALYLLTPGSVAHDVYTNAYQVADSVNVISGVFASEEILQYGRALLCQHASCYFYAVIQPFIVCYVIQGSACPGLGIVGAYDKPRHSRKNHRA